jgi:hypothetical protein
MTQYVINIGALPNDGTGDPLRTAFNETNLNFDQVFAAGPVLSNVRIANNTISTITTNGNLILAPNGIGRIQANATIVPSVANVRDLGSADRRWSTVYTQYINVSGVLNTGDLTVNGNLTVQGNTIQIGNIVTDTKTIQLANTAGNTVAANGSGITVGANDNIATFLYTSGGNRWNTNVGLQVAGASGLQVAGTANVFTLAVNQTANAWIIGGNVLTAPSRATWSSDLVSGDEYITTAPDGYFVLSSQFANGNNASQLHLEHQLAQIVVNNGGPKIWQFNDDGSLSAPGNITANANGNLWSWSNDTMNFPSGATWRSDANTQDEYITSAVDGYITLQTFDNTTSLATQIQMEHGVIRFNIYDGVNVSWTMDQSGVLTTPGAIIPNTSNTHSLGNNTNRWANLYLSGNTIVLGDLSLSAGANGLTSTSGFDLENSTAANIEATGNITATNIISTEWVYGNIGVETQQIQFTDPFEISPEGVNLLLNGGYLVYESNLGSAGGFVPSADDSESIGQSDRQWSTIYGNSIYANVFYGDGSQLTNIELLRINNGNSEVVIPSADGNIDINANGYIWTFGVDSSLAFPDGSNIVGGAFNGTPSSSVSLNAFSPDGNTVSFQAQGNTSNAIIQTYANATATTYNWTFGVDGVLTVPGNIVMPAGSSLVGNGASPAPNISGFNSATFGANVTATGNISGGNLITGGQVTATGNVSGANINTTGVMRMTHAVGSQGEMQFSDGVGSSFIVEVGTSAATWAGAGSLNLITSSSPGGNIGIFVAQNESARFTATGANVTGTLGVTGNITGGNIITTGNITGNTAGYAIGYRDIPQVSFTGNATIATTDAGKHFYSTQSSNFTLTIANNASQGFQVGAAITVVNQGTGTITIAQGSGVTLYLAGNATAGNRSVSTFGMATIMKVATNTWFINGTGVS